jgi:hypothetical protein
MPRHNHSARTPNVSPRKYGNLWSSEKVELYPGDIVLTRFYGDTVGASKTRPAMLYVIEEDSALVLPITSNFGPHDCGFVEVRYYIDAGLVKPCVILGRTRSIDPRTDIVERLGSLSDEDLTNALELFA